MEGESGRGMDEGGVGRVDDVAGRGILDGGCLGIEVGGIE
jgi:hypothetical protein